MAMRVGSDPGAGAGHKIHFVVIKFAFYHFTFFCSACVCKCVRLAVWGSTVVLREINDAPLFFWFLFAFVVIIVPFASAAAAFVFFFVWLLSSCNRSAQTEMSTKCRAKDVFINSPATWPRLNAILRTRTACPTVCPFHSGSTALAFLKAFCCCVSQKVHSMCISCCLSLLLRLCGSVCVRVLVSCVGFGHDFT